MHVFILVLNGLEKTRRKTEEDHNLILQQIVLLMEDLRTVDKDIEYIWVKL